MSQSLPLIIDCQGCGVCCLHIGYPPFVLPTEDRLGEKWWYELPVDLKQEWEAYAAQYKSPNYDGTVESLDGPCTWYDLETGRCKHHPFRPNVCRDFQPGSPGCRQWRNHYQIDRDNLLPKHGNDCSKRRRLWLSFRHNENKWLLATDS